MSVTLYPGDNRGHLAALIEQGAQFDGAVTDPPYGLTSIVKRFGGKNAKAARPGFDKAFQRMSGGFMGKAWDATEIERDPEFWKLVLDVLKPGAFCFAFSGSRTGHWQAVAMEQAGFIMHPMIGWVYAGGFPKGHSAARAIDRKLGYTGIEVAGRYIPITPEAYAFEDWRYGTQTLKPSLEPIYVGQKPFAKRTCAENLIDQRVGALNIGDCLVPYASEADRASARPGGRITSGHLAGKADLAEKQRGGFVPVARDGRYPANLMHDGCEETISLFPRDSDGPGPERFYRAFPFEEADMPSLIYHRKATRDDRAGSKHPTVKPVGLLRELIRLAIPKNGSVLDPFAGSGTTAAAALAEGVEPHIMEMDQDYLGFLGTRFQELTTISSHDKTDRYGGADYFSDLLGGQG